VDNYINFLRSRFSPKLIDAEIEAQAYTYAIDPIAMQELIVSHLGHMWNSYLAPEWERVLPMLQDSVRAFRAYDFSGMSEFEIAQTITGQKLDSMEWETKLGSVERVVYIPNAHIGPYIGHVHVGNAMGLVFGARLPEGALIDAPDLSRAEMLVRLNALADDTRLRILKLVADQGEQRSQDIMNRLELSQSASSRHLKQLSATGYLNERRCEGAKCYSLNPERLEDTLCAIRNFLLGA
jgi:ArsR family transcriptional regulator